MNLKHGIKGYCSQFSGMQSTLTTLRANVDQLFELVLRWSEESAKVLQKNEIAKWACTTPKHTTFRVNTLKISVDEMLASITDNLIQKSAVNNLTPPEVYVHPILQECIVIGSWDTSEMDLSYKENEVIVDSLCGCAVLRGANVYAKGVMGMFPGTKIGDNVSVYADLSKTITKGLKTKFTGDKVFLGNGIVRMERHQLFKVTNEIKRGVAIEMTNPVTGVTMFPIPSGSGMLQNLPSILCVRMMDLEPGLTCLDMCAAPGNKLTHMAALMNNKGLIIALDKSQTKVPFMVETCNIYHATCVESFVCDSTDAFDKNEHSDKSIHDGPPFKAETFDRILLDASCSGLGQRPLLRTFIESKRRLLSYPKLQRKFFHEAVPMLKPGGILVYSTCTLLCEENENMVSWALEEFENLELLPTVPIIGGPGFPVSGLSEEHRKYVQRFGHNCEEDSIGFFLAKFRKKF